MSADAARAVVQREMDKMESRGPDAAGLWSGIAATLGHRRLAVVDLSDRSSQPAVSDDGRLVLLYNGEIYNSAELGARTGAGDTLALLQDIGCMGVDPHRYRGMFAFAVWDTVARELVLVRDRFGIKPAYYASAFGGLVFGSTASSVSRVANLTSMSQSGLQSFLRYGSVQGPSTIFAGVHELDPGSILRWREGSLRFTRYWTFPKARGGPDSAVSLSNALRGSVRSHLVSDVPVALFLSGGVDSAAIGSLAVEAGADVRALTISFPGLAIDETEIARRASQALGLPHEVVSYEAREPNFDRYFAAADQPTIDGLNTYMVAEAAHSTGIKVALSGLGSDELFGGYAHSRRIPLLALGNALVPRWAQKELLRHLVANRDKIAGTIAANSDLAGILEEVRSVFSVPAIRQMMGDYIQPDCGDVRSGSIVDRISNLEFDRYLRNTLLRDADVFGMAHSVEIRTPFVDHRVLEAVVSLPLTSRLVRRKGLLVDAVGHPYLRYAWKLKKRGFVLPYAKWLAGPLRDRVAGLRESPVVAELALPRLDVLTTSQLWALVAISGWAVTR